MSALRSRRISLEAALLLLGFVSLSMSGAFLFPLDSRQQPKLWMFWIAAIAGASILAGTVLYFYNAWRRVPVVPNRRQYVLWVGFETAVVLTLLTFSIFGLVRP